VPQAEGVDDATLRRVHADLDTLIDVHRLAAERKRVVVEAVPADGRINLAGAT